MTAPAREYAGRAVDLLAFQGYDAGPSPRPLAQALALDGGSGSVVAGPEKLAQRFLLELLTESGSMPLLPARGCSFLADARRGAWRTAADARRSFFAALVDVRRTLLAEESDSDPDDERFADADLLGLDLSADRLVLRVAVTSLAGDTRVLLPPLPLTA